MHVHRPPPAPNTIEIDSNLAVRFWMQELMVSRATLLFAVKAVGCDAAIVRQFLATACTAHDPKASDAPAQTDLQGQRAEFEALLQEPMRASGNPDSVIGLPSADSAC